ncbi:MAG: AAA family ATPase [Gammaproteobacteria bacterium]|nr:AAA family ATPase [Gammaproteobacteria bacterium]
MYNEFYGLRELPFTITPDTEYFMNRAGYQDALNVLLVALRSGEGFIKVTGEVGLGKTLLCRKLLASLDRNECVTAYIHNPFLQPDSLLFAVADELKLEYPENINQHKLLRLITKTLLDIHRSKRSVVLCMDEVQAMPVETLETLRLLTNLETEKRKLIQVVLFGQPELDFVLSQPSIRQLKQRITFSYKLLPLNRTALRAYINHRLGVAGYQGRELFTRRALDSLHRSTQGIPRLINILAHKAMLAAYGQGSGQVNHNHIKEAVRDTEETRNNRGGLFPWRPAILRWLLG